jgi:hypothetical protein
MPSATDIRNWLTVLQIGAYVLLLRKLLKEDLARKYWYFSLLIAAEAIRVPLMAALPQRSNLYAHVYFATAPVVWVLFVLVVLEFFQLILKGHFGIASAGRIALSAALGMSVVVSAGTLLLDMQHISAEAALLFNFMLLERMVMTSLLVLLLMLIAFASYFPIPLSRNIKVHAGVFAVYFTVRTAMLFLRVFFGLDVIVAVNIGLQVLGLACVIAWLRLLSPSGEMLPQTTRPTESEERLLAQLESINESLARSARK